MGWRPNLQERAQGTKEPEAGRYGGWEFQEGWLEVLSGGYRSLLFREVPSVNEEPAHLSVLVVLGLDGRLGIYSSRCLPSRS